MNTKKKSVKSVDKNPITPELLPPESKSQLVGFLDSSETVVQYHLAAERCANLSVWCAAMAGAEILKKKKELGHGNGFVEWRKSLPFSESTAKNYMNLAKQLEQRLNTLPEAKRLELLPAVGEIEEQTTGMLQLLNLPSPMDVFNPAHEHLAEIIKDITNGATITQLYFDWDICKPPRQLGGNPALQKWLAEFHPRVQTTRPEDLTPKLQTAFGKWCAVQDAEAAKNHDPVREAKEAAVGHYKDLTLQMYDFMHRHYADLPRGDLRALQQSFSDYAKQIERTLQEG